MYIMYYKLYRKTDKKTLCQRLNGKNGESGYVIITKGNQ